MMRIIKILLGTFCIMFVSFLALLTLSYFGMIIPLISVIYLLYFESILIFFGTAVIAVRNRSVRF